MDKFITVRCLEKGIKWGLRENLNHLCKHGVKCHIAKRAVVVAIRANFPDAYNEGLIDTSNLEEFLRKCLPMICDASGAYVATKEMLDNSYHLDYVVAKVFEGICYNKYT